MYVYIIADNIKLKLYLGHIFNFQINKILRHNSLFVNYVIDYCILSVHKIVHCIFT